MDEIRIKICLARCVRKTIALVIVAVSFCLGSVNGSETTASVGWMMPELKVTDFAGNLHALRQMGQSGSGLIVAFHSTTCPVSRQYGPSLVRLEKDLRQKGLRMVIVNPVPTDSAESIRALLADFPPDLVYVHDKDEKIAQTLGARSTTEVFLFDKALTLQYRGALDDQFSVGTALQKPRHNWLADAADAVVRHLEVSPAVTDPSGCLLASQDHKNAEGLITYHNRISRIIQRNCVECHRDGGLGPFSLETFDDVKAHRGMILKEVDRGQMPPWFAGPLTDESHPGWSNDRSLKAQDKADLLQWLASDLAEGDPADAPLVKRFSDSDWFIGDPDLVFQIPEPITIPAQGKVPYQYRTVDTKLKEDAWVQALEIRPTDRSVVHHVLVFVSPPINKEKNAPEGDGTADEIRGFFAGYVPGTSAMVFPSGYGKKLPKGSRLRFQIHYTPNGRKAIDQISLGVKLLQQPPEHELKVIGVANPGIRIPAGSANHEEQARQKVPTDVELLSFMPHMHVRGKAFRYELIYPDGRRETLVDVPRYDFNWQLRYQLAKPIAVPAGSTILATAVYDNSAANMANPDPAKIVTWGPQTDEEMLLGYVEYEIKGEPKPFEAAPTAGAGPLARLIRGRNREETQKRLFALLDTDRDEFLTKAELGKLANFFPRLKENPDRLENVFQTLDLNDDGKLSRDEMKNIRNLAGGG